MAIHDFTSQRLYVDVVLSPGAEVPVGGPQAHYLLNVMRMKLGDGVLLFNGRDGEWRASLSRAGKRDCLLVVEAMTRPQVAGPDVAYLFAPLKHARLDNTQFGSVEVSLGKAKTSALFRRPSKVFEDMLASGGTGIRVLSLPGVLPLEGGTPILHDGKIIGAIGVSGVKSTEDGQIAAAGVAGLKAQK